MEKASQKVFVMWVFLLSRFSLVDAVAGMGCRREEREALLRLREKLVDPDNWLSSVWVGDDCCKWRGVGCSNETGNVLNLDLSYRLNPGETRRPLSGEIDPSLLALKHLRYLDLGHNVFNGTGIPQFFGSLTSLRYLSLSSTWFNGTVPTQLRNLTNLRYLDLSLSQKLRVDTFQWLANLTSLQYLDMSWVDLSDATDWILAFNSIPSLSVLRLFNCGLSPIPSNQPNQNLSSISILDLSHNSIFNSTIPDWLFNISSSLTKIDLHSCGISGPIPNNILYSLEALDLSHNKLTGPLPVWLGNIRNLRYLYLNDNFFSGPIPPSFGTLSFLRELILSRNNLSSSIPKSLGQLSELVVLDLRSNSLEGVVSDAHFAKLLSLEALFLSSNPLFLDLSATWVPPFQLKNINLRSCKMGPWFPSWLQTQTEFSTLDISDAGISDQVPNWFWNLSSRIFLLNMSYNQITGNLPASLEYFGAAVIDLTSNRFQGSLSSLNSSVQALYVSNNSFSGDLQPVLKETMQRMQGILLSGNRLHGSLPSSLCELKSLLVIDLSENLLSGEFPKCQRASNNWVVLNLATNNLQGPIPEWLGSLQVLMTLHSNNSSLQGEIPISLQNCKQLEILDLGENKLNGRIPTWIGEHLSSLFALRLRSNMFNGSIPQELSYLYSLQILDLAHNALSGTCWEYTLNYPQNKFVEPVFNNFCACTIT